MEATLESPSLIWLQLFGLKSMGLPTNPIIDPLTKRLLNVETTLNDIMLSLRVEVEELRERLQRVIHAIESEFPINGRSTSLEERAMAFHTLKWMMRGPAVLYAIGMNGPAVVDLYGYLEAYSLRDASNHLSSSEDKRAALRNLLTRRTLHDVAPIFRHLGIWDTSDVAFVERFAVLRNSLAHKNPAGISKQLLLDKPIRRFAELETAAAKINFGQYFARSTRLLIKLYRAYQEQPKAQRDGRG